MSLTVDGVEVEQSGSVLDAVLRAGASLPHLCKDDNLPVLGACRTCLVEADGRIVAACSTPAASVREVRTSSERVSRVRRGVLELTAGMQVERPGVFGGPHARASAEAMSIAGVRAGRYALHTAITVDDSNPFFSYHEEACILCGRCTTACQSLQHIGAIGLAGRGTATKVTPGAGVMLGESICTSCGSCVAACPTQALRPRQGGA